MNDNFREKTNKERELVEQELINIGFKKYDSIDFTYITKETVNDCPNKDMLNMVCLKVYPSILAYHGKTEIWWTIAFDISNFENKKYYELNDRVRNVLRELKEIFKKSKYKFFYDEDAVQGMFSHPQLKQNTNSFLFKAYCNPAIPEGAWSNHTLG